MSDRVRELLWIRVPSGTYSLEAMAKQLGVSGRTIERQLKQDGTSFSALLNQVRAEMVRQYLESAGRPLYVIAELMGFSALSAVLPMVPGRIRMQPIGMARDRRQAAEGRFRIPPLRMISPSPTHSRVRSTGRSA